MGNKIRFVDEKGRILLQTQGDRVLVARYADMTDGTKKIVLDVYVELTGEEPSRIKGFLNFENDDMEFCS